MSAPIAVDPQASPAARAVSTTSRSRYALQVVPPILIPIIFWFLPLNLEPRAQHAIAVTLFMILAWATEILDHGVTGLVGCYLFWASKIVPFDVAFSGFANDTPWFLMGAILFGIMASKSGLARRLAYSVTLR